MIVQPSSSRVKSVMDLCCCWLLSLLVNAPNCHLSLVLASVVQGDAVNCNNIQVCLYASWGHLIVKMQHSTTRQLKQKISPNLDHHWSKNSSFLCVQTNWVCPSGTQRFCKNDSDSSQWLWLESSHSVKNVTRVELPKIVIRLESSHWLESRYHWVPHP